MLSMGLGIIFGLWVSFVIHFLLYSNFYFYYNIIFLVVGFVALIIGILERSLIRATIDGLLYGAFLMIPTLLLVIDHGDMIQSLPDLTVLIGGYIAFSALCGLGVVIITYLGKTIILRISNRVFKLFS